MDFHYQYTKYNVKIQRSTICLLFHCLKKQQVEFPDIEFSGIIKKKSCGISRSLGFTCKLQVYLEFLRGVTEFGGVSSREPWLCLEFPGIKVRNLNNEGGEVQKSMSSIPRSHTFCLFFFLEQPITFLPVHHLTFVFLAVACQWPLQCDYFTAKF